MLVCKIKNKTSNYTENVKFNFINVSHGILHRIRKQFPNKSKSDILKLQLIL